MELNSPAFSIYIRTKVLQYFNSLFSRALKLIFDSIFTNPAAFIDNFVAPVKKAKSTSAIFDHIWGQISVVAPRLFLSFVKVRSRTQNPADFVVHSSFSVSLSCSCA